MSWLTALRLSLHPVPSSSSSTSASTSSFSRLWCNELSERSSWDPGSLSGGGAGRLRESLRRGDWGESSQLVVTWCQRVRWWEREHCIRLQVSRLASKSFVDEEEDWPQKKA